MRKRNFFAALFFSLRKHFFFLQKLREINAVAEIFSWNHFQHSQKWHFKNVSWNQLFSTKLLEAIPRKNVENMLFMVFMVFDYFFRTACCIHIVCWFHVNLSVRQEFANSDAYLFFTRFIRLSFDTEFELFKKKDALFADSHKSQFNFQALSTVFTLKIPLEFIF